MRVHNGLGVRAKPGLVCSGLSALARVKGRQLPGIGMVTPFNDPVAILNPEPGFRVCG